MERLQLKAKKRDLAEKASRLRRQGFIPAVIYNHGKTDHIQVWKRDVNRLFAHGVNESVLIDLELEGKNEVVFVKDYELHPVTEEVLHLDFYRVTFGEKIRTHVAIHLTGKAQGVKEGGVMEQFLHEVVIEIYPKDLMPSLEIDVSHMKIGDILHVNDLKLPEGARILMEGNPAICHITRSAKAESEEKAEANK
ncbi:MAG: 50S ribosomal protein L25 [Leptospiraceae bacterium]|nr:50S ribosomal protein L25 [Leptospiraceae bacterium]MDW8306653.1 50S ribosomal protein L25 [Leptospiraceae bacterium]